MAVFRKAYLIKYIPTMGESGFVSDVDWKNGKFNYNSPHGDNMEFTPSERDRFLLMFPHLQFASFPIDIPV